MFLILLLSLARNPGDIPVNYKVIEEGRQSPFTTMSAVLISNQEVWEVGYSYIHSSKIPSPKPPSINFKDSVAILVTIGERKTAGYGMEVESVVLKQGKLLITVREKCPKSAAGLLQVITQPYLILQIPRLNWEKIDAKFIDCQGKEFFVPVKRGMTWLETIKK